MEDLGGSDILVLDGDASGACGLGIESTVAKIDVKNDQILILRMGGVTQDRIREALKEGGKEFSGIKVHAGSVAGGKTEVRVESEQEGGQPASSRKEPAEAEGQAPGETLSPHYSCRFTLVRQQFVLSLPANASAFRDVKLYMVQAPKKILVCN